MPNIKSAKKKLKQDVRRTNLNSIYKNCYKKAVKDYLFKPSKKLLDQAFSLIDKAAKVSVIHKNKAANLKSSLAKELPKKNGK